MKNLCCFNFRFRFFASCVLAVAVLTALIASGAGPSAAAGDNGSGAAQAQTGQESQLLDRIQDHYQHTTSFSAKFTEELIGISASKRTRYGRVSYKRPGRMRWEFDAPQTETVVSDGRKLYDYQPDLNQVLEVPLDRAFKSAAPLSFLLGMGDLRRDFNVSIQPYAASDPMLRVVLTPKGGGDRVEMGLNPSTYDLMAAKVTDALGNTTSIRFNSVRTNVQLADSMFRFEVPPGADVVLPPGAAPPPQHL
jgi:outer membrane lipoprotein carrier protein